MFYQRSIHENDHPSNHCHCIFMGSFWDVRLRDERVYDAKKSVLDGGHGIEVATMAQRMGRREHGERRIGTNYASDMVSK